MFFKNLVSVFPYDVVIYKGDIMRYIYQDLLSRVAEFDADMIIVRDGWYSGVIVDCHDVKKIVFSFKKEWMHALSDESGNCLAGNRLSWLM